MRARCPPERDGDLAFLDAHRNFVLHPGQRQAYAVVTCQKWPLGQFPEHRREFARRELAIAVTGRRQRLARRSEGDGARTFAADLFQHREVVASANSEIAGDDLALGFFRQYAGEVGPALIALEAFLP